MAGPYPPYGATNTARYLNSTTQVKSTPGAVVTVNVLVAGAPGTIYDCVGTAGAITGNEVAVVPATVGPIVLGFPCLTGILYVPGSGQVVSISYV